MSKMQVHVQGHTVRPGMKAIYVTEDEEDVRDTFMNKHHECDDRVLLKFSHFTLVQYIVMKLHHTLSLQVNSGDRPGTHSLSIHVSMHHKIVYLLKSLMFHQI